MEEEVCPLLHRLQHLDMLGILGEPPGISVYKGVLGLSEFYYEEFRQENTQVWEALEAWEAWEEEQEEEQEEEREWEEEEQEWEEEEQEWEEEEEEEEEEGNQRL